MPASALTPDGYDIPYFGATGIYEFPDSDRDSQNGRGFRVLGGYPLTEHGSIEGSFYTLERKRHIDGNKDYQRGVFADYVYDFGLYGFDTSFVPNFKPYTLGGIGAIQEDVRGHKNYRPGLDLGAGLFIPLKFGGWDWGWGVRAEYRYQIEYNDRKTEGPNSRFLYDQRVEVGLNIPLSFIWRPHGPAPAPAPEPVQVVPVEQPAAPAPAPTPTCEPPAPGQPITLEGCKIGDTIVLRGVNFDFNKATLTPNAKALLDQVADALQKRPDIKVEIDGHTDGKGSAPYNQKLSERRADSVKQYLVGRGIDAGRMSTKGFGKTQPIADNNTEEGRELNRRVELKVTESSATAAPAAAPADAAPPAQ